MDFEQLCQLIPAVLMPNRISFRRASVREDMQQFIDYIAILAFVVVYFVTKDIFLATGVLMGGVTLQIGIYWLIKKPIGSELKLTFWASMILGEPIDANL